MLDQITPVLLTFNEAPNIARTLSHLTWARDIVVVDSGSTDDTLALLSNWPNVRLFSRKFDTHAGQWRYGTTETGIATSWILRLDADYQLTEELIDELQRLDPEAAVDGYSIAFDYAVFSHKLRSSLYPANTILLRRGRFTVTDDGHTERWTVEGSVKRLNAHVIHDDWKDTQEFINAQGRYMRKELAEISEKGASFRDWLRLTPPVMPIAVFIYCLFGKGLILNGRAGIFYALQRTVAEAILALMVLERRLRMSSGVDEQAERKTSGRP